MVRASNIGARRTALAPRLAQVVADDQQVGQVHLPVAVDIAANLHGNQPEDASPAGGQLDLERSVLIRFDPGARGLVDQAFDAVHAHSGSHAHTPVEHIPGQRTENLRQLPCPDRRRSPEGHQR